MKTCLFILLLIFFHYPHLAISHALENILTQLSTIQHSQTDPQSIKNSILLFQDLSFDYGNEYKEIHEIINEVASQCALLARSSEMYTRELSEKVASKTLKKRENMKTIESHTAQVKQLKQSLDNDMKEYESLIASDQNILENTKKEITDIQNRIVEIKNVLQVINDFFFSEKKESGNISFIEIKPHLSNVSNMLVDHKDFLGAALISNLINYPNSDKQVLNKVVAQLNQILANLRKEREELKNKSKGRNEIQRIKENSMMQIKGMIGYYTNSVELLVKENTKIDQIVNASENILSVMNKRQMEYLSKCEELQVNLSEYKRKIEAEREIIETLNARIFK